MTATALPLPGKERITQSRILVVGDVMLDRYWHGDVARISPEAPVPVVQVKREELRLGGAANVALNIRTLGAQVTLLSAVGVDEAAHTLKKLLAQHRIDAELDEHQAMDTTVKLRVIGRSQQMLRIDFEKTPDIEVLAGLLKRFPALLDQHDVVLFSDYGKGGLTHIASMIGMARQAQKPVLIDPKGSDWTRYAGATVITPNRAELSEVVGSWSDETQFEHKAQALRQQLGLHALLVTRSEEGMTLFEEDRATTVPALAREVADVTGAGDTVIATLALMMACGIEPQQAMALANRAGSLVVAKFGTACLTYEELLG